MEIYLTINEKDYRNLPQIIVCNDLHLSVIIEGCPPMCLRCHKTGHGQTQCELIIENSEKTKEIPQEEIKREAKRDKIEKDLGRQPSQK